MEKTQKALLLKIMAMEFVAVEYNLYLDTHPQDHLALADYYGIVTQLKRAKEEYEESYGPLFNFGWSRNLNNRSWQWINEPWPWEITY